MSLFMKHLKEQVPKIGIEINKFFNEKRKETPFMKKNFDILEKFVLNGGKRIRPITFIMAYKGFGGEENILRQALSVEFFHNATLVVDDFMDEDESRRNKPTVYKILKDNFLKKNKEKKYKGSLFNRESSRYAVTDATLLGNILYSFGSECLNSTEIEALEVYHKAYEIVNEGQILDVDLEKKKQASEQDYIDMAERKSSNLIMASAEIGAILAGAHKKNIEALKKYACDITLAFQIADDLMDIDPNSKKGHELGSDIKQGKRTLTIIYALKKGNKKQKQVLLKALGNPKAKKRQIKNSITILHDTGAVEYSKDFAKKRVQKGKKWLKKAELNKQSELFFMEMADFFIERNI